MFLTVPRTDFTPVHAMLMQSIASKGVMAAVELRLFDYLEEAKTVAQLADEMNLMKDRVEPLLDILVAAGLLEEDGGRYANAEVGSEFLVTGKPLYQGLGMQLTMQFIGSLDSQIAELLTGKEIDRSITDAQWGDIDVMEGTAQDARGSGLAPVVDMVAGLPGFQDFRTMCDIGGNHGSYIMGVLSRNDLMNGVLFDLPHVAEQATERFKSNGFGDRIEARELDFREGRLPAETFDLALTSHFLYGFKHDLNDAIGRIADGLKPGGWFVSHHYAGRNESGFAMTSSSLELLTRLCGYPSHFVEREELNEALSANGFEDIRFRKVTDDGMGLITVARKTA